MSGCCKWENKRHNSIQILLKDSNLVHGALILSHPLHELSATASVLELASNDISWQAIEGRS